MDQRTGMFVGFIAFSLACFAMGYIGRKRGFAKERWSRPLHLHTVIWLWSPVTGLAFWGLGAEAARDVTTLMLAEPVLMIGPGLVMAMTVMLLGLPREQRGVMTIAAALSNHGFTLGAYLCYALLDPPESALRYGIAYVTSMQLFMVLIFYPVASHYSPDGGRGLVPLMRASFLTVRAMPLYAAVVGCLLNLAHVPFPDDFIERYHIMHILFFAGAAGSNSGIGLRFRFGDTLGAIRLHVLLAGAQFIVHPLMAAGLLMAIAAIGYPASPLVRNVMLIEALTPTALNMVIIANLFHLDARLASGLWLWNTIAFCVIVLPIVIYIW